MVAFQSPAKPFSIRLVLRDDDSDRCDLLSLDDTDEERLIEVPTTTQSPWKQDHLKSNGNSSRATGVLCLWRVPDQVAEMAKNESQIIGRLRITFMTVWHQGFVTADVLGYIEFNKNSPGEF